MELEHGVEFCQTDFLSSSFSVFTQMRQRGELCDLTFKVKNRSFTAHRLVLSAGIPYFRTVFVNSEMNTSEENEISAAGLDPIALEYLINFAYSGKVKITEQNVYSLLLASEFLHLEQIHETCSAFLSKRIYADNVLDIRELGESRNIPVLIESAKIYVRKYLKEFSRSDNFEYLTESWIKEIICDDELQVCGEHVVVEAILKWVSASRRERRGLLPELMEKIRLVHLPTEYLMYKVAANKLIRNCIGCRDMIDEATNYRLSKSNPMPPHLKTMPRKYSGVTHDLYAICSEDSKVSVHKCDIFNEMWCSSSQSKVQDNTVLHVATINNIIYTFLEKTIHAFSVKKQEGAYLNVRLEKLEGAAIASHGTNIYFFGSFDQDFRQKIRCFSVTNAKWLKESKLKIGSDSSAAATLGESIYLTGGYRGYHSQSNTVEKYFPSTGQWTPCASMLYPRTSHSCCSMNGKLYACGGFSVNGVTNTAEVYDPLVNQWNPISSMRLTRSNFSFVCSDGKLIAVGNKLESLGFCVKVETYDPDFDHWSSANYFVPDGFRAAVTIPVHCKRKCMDIFDDP